jgi:predicted O-linked N-acetylglucosamine transferase (SPINDLY family)
MSILQAVPGSVLWLLGGHGVEALRGAARARGVDPSRLVFASKLPKPEHLARHAVADLFLDTHTCNAHTTASDALWAGLPVLTCPGSAFAARVCTSLLHAVGLPELIARDLAEYERVAVALARDPAALRTLRDRLGANRRVMPLFDTARFTRGLEAAIAAVHARHREGRPPEPLDLTL